LYKDTKLHIIHASILLQINETVADWTGNSICPKGYYCPNGTDFPVPCPAGTYSTLVCQSWMTVCHVYVADTVMLSIIPSRKELLSVVPGN